MTDLSVPSSLSVTLSMTDELKTALRQGEGYIEVAKAYEIVTHEDAQLAVNERNACLKAVDRLKEMKKGFVAPAKEIIANAEALFDPAIEGYQESVKILNARIGAHEQRERLRIESENRAREEAARKARQEAERIAAEERARAEEIAAQKRREAEAAERKRQEAEAAGNARAAAAAAAAAARAQEAERAALENGAAKAEAAHMDAAALVTAAAPEPAPKLAGNTIRENYVAELAEGFTDESAKAAIAAACATRPELLAMLKLDTSALNKMAKALKKAFNVPGYKAVDRPIVAGSRQ